MRDWSMDAPRIRSSLVVITTLSIVSVLLWGQYLSWGAAHIDPQQDVPYLYAYKHLTGGAAVSKATYLMLQDTVHYQPNTIEGVEEFETLLPPTGHTVHIDDTVHTVALFHQLRCLDILRSHFAHNQGETQMARHCMNYIRQSILCLADVKLEPALQPYLNESHVVQFKGDYVCKDWTAVYDTAREKQSAFSAPEILEG